MSLSSKNASPTLSAGLVPVHVGQHPPGSETEQALLRQWENRRDDRMSRDPDEHLRVPAGLDWAAHGLSPRWIGHESGDCTVAIEPGRFHNHGAMERERFFAGARARGELAVVIAGIGDASEEDDLYRSVLFAADASVHLSNFTYMSGKRLPKGTTLRMAEDLTPEDRDLALRLLNSRAETQVWWSLTLHGARSGGGDSWGVETEHPADGHLVPILVDGLGAPVVAAWTPDAEDQRWYIVPDGTDWDTLLDWLMKRALPALVPTALRRVRSAHFEDPELQTRDERSARLRLVELERAYARDRDKLKAEFDLARARAETVRDHLLFGSGSALATAVASVLQDSGLHVLDLDAELGSTRSADLLITGANSQRRLVEIKSASGSPKEDLARDLERHLATWPQLRPHDPVAGGVLVINHQNRLHPTERTAQVYARSEFVESLTYPVLSTWQLFRWWAEGDFAAVVTAVFPESDNPEASAPGPTWSPRRSQWWRLGR